MRRSLAVASAASEQNLRLQARGSRRWVLPRLEALLAGASTAGVHFVQCSATVCLVNAHCICVIAPCCSHGGSSCGHAALPDSVVSGRALAMASLPSSDGAVARSVQDSFDGLMEFLSMPRLSLKGCCSSWLRGRVLAGKAHGFDHGVQSLCQSPPPRPPLGGSCSSRVLLERFRSPRGFFVGS